MMGDKHRIIGLFLTCAAFVLFLFSTAFMARMLFEIGAVSPFFSRGFLVASFLFLLSMTLFMLGIERFHILEKLERKAVEMESYRAKDDKFGLSIIFLLILLAFYIAIDSIAPQVDSRNVVWAIKIFFRYFIPLLVPFLIPFVLMYILKKK